MRVLLLVGVLMMASSVEAQTRVGVFTAGIANPNMAKPITEFTVLEQCGRAMLPETAQKTDRPDTAAWSDVNPALDCVADLTSTPIAALPPLAPNGYQAALKIGVGQFGALTTAFLAPAQVPPVPTIESGKPFRVQAPHDCQNTVAYRLYIDGVKDGNDIPATACSGGTVTASSTGVATGTHAASIRPVDSVDEIASPSVAFQASAPPPPRANATGTPTVAQP